MNINEAKSILKDLQLAKTFQFSSVYIVSNSIFSRSKLIKRHSLLGRFTEFFSVPESEKVKEKKIHILAAQALAFLIKEREKLDASPEGLSEGLWRMRLEKQLREENLLEPVHEDRTLELLPNSEFGKFQNLHADAVNEKVKQELDEIRNYSLLQAKQSPKHKSSLNPKEQFDLAVQEFKTNTDIYGDITSSSLQVYTNALYQEDTEDFPVAQKMNLLDKAKNYQKSLENKYRLHKKSDKAQRLEEIAKDSKFIEGEVQELKEGESWLFMGSCGQKEIHMDKLFSLLQCIPEASKKELSKPVQKLLAVEKLPDPKAFIDELIQRAFTEIDLYSDKLEGDLDFLRVFLPDSARKLPDSLKAVLPAKSAALLEQALQNGPIENSGLLLNQLSKISEKELPQVLTSRLPENVKNNLQNVFKGGFLANLAYLSQQMPATEFGEFLELFLQVLDLTDMPHTTPLAALLQLVRMVPSENGVKILRLMVDSLHNVSTQEKRKKLRAQIENLIKSNSSFAAEMINDKMNASLASVFEKARSKFPPAMMSSLDPEGYFTFSHFWVECKKESKNYTILIYPSQALLKKHYGDAEKVQWPLEIRNVSPEKLNSDFFYKLLYQTIEPQFTSDCDIRGEDFYQGILDYLKDKPFLNRIEDFPQDTLEYTQAKLNTIHPKLNMNKALWVSKHEDFGSEMALAKLMTTPRSFSPSLLSLQIYFESLTEFCRSIPRVNSILDIQDMAMCASLESFIKTGMQEVEKQKQFLSADLYRSYKATKTEILHAVHSFKLKNAVKVEEVKTANGLNLSEPVFHQIQSAFHKVGIDDAYIRFSKPTLAWAFGDEVEDFIDTLADSVGPLPENGPARRLWIEPAKKTDKKGWLHELVSNTYFSLAIMALKTILALTQFYRGTTPPLVALSTGYFVGKNFLPEAAKAWLMQAFGMLIQKVVQGITYLVLRCLMNPEQINQMQVFAGAWSRTVKRLAENALGKEEISFDLTGEHEESTKPFEPTLRIKFDSHSNSKPPNEQILDLDLTAIEKPLPELLLKELRTWNTRLNEFKLAHVKSIDEAKSYKAESVEQPQSSESLLNQLISWSHEFVAEAKPLEESGIAYESAMRQDEQLCQYMLRVINTLPIPQAGYDAYWDAVPHPGLHLQEIGGLAETFSRVSGKSLHAETIGAVTVSMYALLAIMDKLRCRMPELHLQGYDLDYFDFVIWIGKRDSKISDPVIVERMNQILYFYGLSYDRLPPAFEVQKLRKSLMFSGSGQNLEFACRVEERYLKERVADPQVLARLLKSSLNIESFKALKNSSAKVKNSLIALLIQFRYQGELTRDHIHEIKKTKPKKGEKAEPSKEEYLEWFDAIMQAVHEPQWMDQYPALHRLLESFFITQKTSIDEQVNILRYDSADIKDDYILDKSFVALKKQALRCKRYLNSHSIQDQAPVGLSSQYAKLAPNQLWYVKDIIPKGSFDYISQVLVEKSTPSQYKSESEVIHSGTSSTLPAGLQLSLSEKTESIMRAVGFFQENKQLFENPECALVFSDILFECGRLTDLVSKQPHLAPYIAHFFTDLYDYYVDQSKPEVALKVLYLGRKVALLMQKSVKENPAFSMDIPLLLSKLEKSLAGDLKQILLYNNLYALAYDKKDQRLVVSLFITRLLSENTASVSDQDKLLDRMQSEVEEKFWESLPAIHDYFFIPSNVQGTVQAVIRALGILSPELEDLTWTQSADDNLVFTNGTYVADLLKGSIKELTSNKDIVEYVKAIRSAVQQENIPDQNTLRMTAINRFTSQKSGITITVKEKGQDHILHVVLDHAGRRFEFFRNNSEAFSSQSTWIEVKENAHFSILALPSKKYYGYSTAHKLLFNTEAQLIRVDAKRAFESLLSLARFCPVSLMDLYAAKGKNTIEKIVFKPFNLTFIVKWSNGKQFAYNSGLFSDFYISPKQFDPQLNIFGSYLLLENEAGERKVILPHSQWKSSLLMRFLKEAGPWATPVIALISRYYVEEKSSFSVFEMTRDGKLMSDDPAGLGLLTALYLLNGHTKLAKQTCLLFEKLCKRVSLDEATFMSLVPFLLFPIDVVDGILSIRQRMLAAVEENQRAGIRPPVKLDAHIHSLIAFSIILDLTTQKKTTLTDFQEWFLFKGYFYHATQAVELFQDQTILPLNFLVENSTAVLETFALSDQLKMRFAVLDRRLNTNKPFTERAIKLIKEPKALPRRVLNFCAKHVPKMVAAPSRYVPMKFLTKVILTPNPIANDAFFREESLVKRFWNLIARSQLKLNFDIRSLKLESLIEELRVDKTDVSFKFSELTAAEFKQGYLTYYEIARAGQLHPHWKDLAQLLSLARGGWDKQTQILIEYLFVIQNRGVLSIQNPRFLDLYPTAKAFREVVFLRKNVMKATSLEFEKRYPEIIHFFQSLTSRMVGLKFAERCTHEGLQWLVNNQIKALGIGQIPVVNTWMLPSLTTVLLNNTASAVTLMLNERTSAAPQRPSKQTKQLLISDYSYLNKDDAFFDHVMQEVFDQAFTVKEKKVSKDDIFEKINIKELTDSYQEFYVIRGSRSQEIGLKSEAALWTAYCLLSEKVNRYQKQLIEERKQFISLFVKDSSKDSEEIFERLKKCFLKGDFSDMMKGLVFEPGVLRSLELSFACHLVRCTRVQQMTRAAVCLEELAREEIVSVKLQSRKIQRFAEELSAKRNYQFADLELRLLRRILVFEFDSNNSIWQRPLESIKKALLEDNAVIELLPSLGKNHTFGPLLNAILASRGEIVLNIFPAPMFESSFRKLSTQSQMFYQIANVLRVNRKAVLNTENLTALLAIFLRSLECNESINLTKEDLQAIDLLFVVNMDDYIQNVKTDPDFEEVLTKLARILLLIRTKCKIIGDEAQELFNYRRQLNYPIGPSNVIPSSEYAMIESCMEAAADILEDVRKNHDHGISETDYAIKVARPVAQKMVAHSVFKGLDEYGKKELEDFFATREKHAARWIKEHPLYRQMSMVRGVLSDILFLVANSILNVDFGPSLNNQGEYARPYEGNTTPLEKFSITNPHVAMVKTFDQFLQSGLTESQLAKILDLLKRRIQKEAEHNKVPVSATAGYSLLKSVFGEVAFDWTKPEAIETTQTARLMKHPKMIILYVRHFVQHQVRYWNESACSTSLDAAEMAESGIYVTGTPENFGTYSPQLEMRRDPGNLGEAVHIIHQRYTGYDAIKAITPRAILKEVLDNVAHLEEFAILGDCGPTPLLTGLKGEEIARIMVDFIKENKIPNIFGVVFFKKDAEGRNVSVYLGKDAADVVPFDAVTVLPEQRWTYYDDNSGFSANIPQKANARIEILAGEGITLTKFIQMCFRSRDIKEEDKLIGFSSEAMASQTIHLSVLQKLKSKLAPLEKMKFENIIQLAHRNEARDLKEGNYYAFPQKLHAKDRRVRMDKVLRAGSLDEMAFYFKEFRPFFIQKLEVDPINLYASIKMKRSSKIACDTLREQTFKATEVSPHFTQAEKEALKQMRKDIKLHDMPEKVNAYYTEGHVQSGATSDLNRIAQVEHDNDIDLDLHHQFDHGDLGKPFNEWSWTPDFDPHAENWLYFSSPQGQSIASSFKRFINTNTPPLYAVTELLKASSKALFAHTADKFDARIWFSNNFLPTYLNNAQEKKAEIGTELQRRAFNIVMQIDETDTSIHVVSAGCISIKDASALRSCLDANLPKTKRKTFIFDAQAKRPIAGPRVDMARLENTTSFVAMIAQLKFLSGSIDYSKAELVYLDQWLETAGRERMKEVFEQIYFAHESSGLLGTAIDALLKKDRSPFEQL